MRQDSGILRVTRLLCVCAATLLLAACQTEFWSASGLAIDKRGDLYVADTGNHAIRKIAPNGSVSTFAGGYKNGGGNARLEHPEGLAFDAEGNLYVSDSGTNRILRITPAGAVTILAGSDAGAGYRDGQGTAAQFNRPLGVAVDAGGDVYVADHGNDVIRKISASGGVTTLAGTAGGQFCWAFRNGTGSAARFAGPASLAIGPDGNIYVGDAANDSIRKITPEGVVTTIAGNGRHYSEDSYRDGSGIAARFNGPTSIAFDPRGDLLVADSGNRRIRKVTLNGVATTVAATEGTLPHSVAADRNGNVYIGVDSSILRVGPDGSVSTLAGSERRLGYRDSSGLPLSVDFDTGFAVLMRFFVFLSPLGMFYVTRGFAAGVADAGHALRVTIIGYVIAAILGVCALASMIFGYSVLFLLPFDALPVVLMVAVFRVARGPRSFSSQIAALSVPLLLVAWLYLFLLMHV